MLNKSLKEEYTKYFKELKNIIACVFYSILCFAPTILFFIYLFILGDNNPPLNDSLLAILLQILYLPLPGWIYINRHYSYTIKELNLP